MLQLFPHTTVEQLRATNLFAECHHLLQRFKNLNGVVNAIVTGIEFKFLSNTRNQSENFSIFFCQTFRENFIKICLQKSQRENYQLNADATLLNTDPVLALDRAVHIFRILNSVQRAKASVNICFCH